MQITFSDTGILTKETTPEVVPSPHAIARRKLLIRIEREGIEQVLAELATANDMLRDRLAGLEAENERLQAALQTTWDALKWQP